MRHLDLHRFHLANLAGHNSYTPKQLQYGTGGPKAVEQLYTREMLASGFADFDNITITVEELELSEGAGHAGMSAVIGLTGRKPA